MAELSGCSLEGAAQEPASPPVMGFKVVAAPSAVSTPKQALLKRSSLLSLLMQRGTQDSGEEDFDSDSDLSDQSFCSESEDYEDGDLSEPICSPTKPVPCPPSR